MDFTLAPKPVADWSGYDFIDFGSNRGGSIVHCAKRWKARGIGIDNDLERVADMHDARVECLYGDAAKLDAEKVVRFVSMMNFLEHLPNLAIVEATIAGAARAARDFLFIRHPSFEREEEARASGYIIGHWGSEGHPTHIKLSDFAAMFARLGIGPAVVHDVEAIANTDHAMVVGLGGEKPRVAIDPPLWRRHDIFVPLRPMKAKYWDKLTRPLRKDADKLGRVHTLARSAHGGEPLYG